MRNKESTSPGLTLVLLIGLLNFSIGSFLGVASLVTLPVVQSLKPIEPEKIVPGTVYYIKGKQSQRTAWKRTNWRAKEDAWRADIVDVLRLNEPELNQWSRERLNIDAPPGANDLSDLEATFQYLPTAANFRILDDRIQLATRIKLGGYLKDMDVIYQVEGHFQNSRSGIQFVPVSGHLGSAPLGRIPVIKNLLFSVLIRRFSEIPYADWLGESFGNLESAEIEEGELVLRRKAEG